MHLGNLFAALISWLSVRQRGGRWVLRIEDLDPQRSRREHALMIEDDLRWLGLDWDFGGVDGVTPDGEPCSQSCRGPIYERWFERLAASGLCYPCACRRADIMASQAPHQSDGRVVYSGRCRPASFPVDPGSTLFSLPHSTRVAVTGDAVRFTDAIYGAQEVDLSAMCGDFIVRRADGVWAYQFAVVVDDALMGVNEVVRGSDLLLSAAQQIYLYRLLGLESPVFCHIPLLCNGSDGRRLSKRDQSLSAASLRERYTPGQLLALLGRLAGQDFEGSSVTLAELLERFDIGRISREMSIGIDLGAI